MSDAPTNHYADLPDAVRIGPFDFKLSVVDEIDEGESVGAFDYTTTKIDLAKNPSSGAFAVDTVIHEITHGLYRVFMLQPNDGEERVVSSLATGLTQVLRDNPSLVEWIRKTVRY